ncbi:MAG: hypothetical protein AAGD92_16670 [Pseudomonadota bacterium]
MSRLPDAFYEDRALRDAARDVLFADVEHAKNTLSGRAIAGRVAGRVGDGAKDVLEVAKVHATDKQGLLAGLIAIVALFLAREPIMEVLGLAEAVEDDSLTEAEAEPDDEASLDGDIDQSESDPEAIEADGFAMSGSASPNNTPPDISEDEPLKTGETA